MLAIPLPFHPSNIKWDVLIFQPAPQSDTQLRMLLNQHHHPVTLLHLLIYLTNLTTTINQTINIQPSLPSAHCDTVCQLLSGPLKEQK